MSSGSIAVRTGAGPVPRGADRAVPVVALVLTVPVACALALALYRYPAPLAFALAAAVGLLAVVLLAVSRYTLAVGVAVALLGVTLAEPSPSDVVFVVLIALACVTGRFQPSRAYRSVVAILALVAALNLLSAIEVSDIGRATAFMLITLYLALLALWLSGFVVTRARARVVLRGYVVAAVASSLLGLLGLLGAIPGAETLVSEGRARALFQDPNVFGPFLVPAALLLLEEIARPQLLTSRTATKVLLFCIVVLGVLFSYSRGAWLNFVIGLVVMGTLIVLRGSSREILTVVVTMAAVAVLVPTAIVATGSADFLAERAQPQAYDEGRFAAQSAGIRAADTYLLGAGPGQFEEVAGLSAHSTYARALGEQGYPGLLAVLTLLGLTLVLAARNAARRWSTYGLGSAALLGAWCGLIVNSAFIDTLHWRHLWVLAALIWIVAPPRRAHQEDFRP